MTKVDFARVEGSLTVTQMMRKVLALHDTYSENKLEDWQETAHYFWMGLGV